MSLRRDQPEPFVRGAIYPATPDVPYPRANPTDMARLPGDVWSAAGVPAGVRLELVGDAQAIDVAYRTTNGNLGYRGDGAGITFSVWRGARKICEHEADLGDGLIRLSLGSGRPETPATIYLPEGMQPLVLSLTAVSGEIAPAPARPVWLAYGDWITQGWIASGPARGWAAIAARKAKLNLVNLGYAGAGRGEIVSAEHIAALPAEIITIAYGESCWTRVPHSAGMVSEGLRAFLQVIRQSHPTTPVVVASPILRPDAEDVPNKLGATLGDIRQAIESVTSERIEAGDSALSLVPGAGIINAGHLADGIHPGDEGHKRIAAAMTRALTTAMDAAAAGRAAEVTAAEAAAAEVVAAEVAAAEVVAAEAVPAEAVPAEALKQEAEAQEAQADIPKRRPAAGRGVPKQGIDGSAPDSKGAGPVRRMTRKSPPKSAPKSGAANGAGARGTTGSGSRGAAAVAAAAKRAAESAAVSEPEHDGSELDGADESRGSGRPALAYAAYGH